VLLDRRRSECVLLLTKVGSGCGFPLMDLSVGGFFMLKGFWGILLSMWLLCGRIEE
jgi:hypothetical protein